MKGLGASIRIFVSSAWLSYVALFAWSEPKGYVASVIIAPLTYMLFFMYLGITATGRGTSEFYLVGNALQTAAMSGIFGVTMTVGNERDLGSLPYLIGSPANRLAVFVGRASMNILNGCLSVGVSFGWALLLGLDLTHANLPGLALTTLVVAISTSGLGLLMGSLSLMALNVMFVNNTMYFALLIISGANLPLDKMPGWMHAISTGVPLTRGIQAARLLVNGASLTEVLPLLIGELAIGLAYALIGFAFFRWIEFQARRQGTLEAF